MLDFGKEWTRILAPATIANLGPGFDVLGVAVRNVEDIGYSGEPTLLGDVVHLRRLSGGRSLLTIREVYTRGRVDNTLTTSPRENVAGIAALSVASQTKGAAPLEMILEKMPFRGSGMGSSAASAVAGAYSALVMTGKEDKESIAETVVKCEVGKHPDNVLPALFGGFVGSFGLSDDHKRFEKLLNPDILALQEAVYIAQSAAPLDSIIGELSKLDSAEVQQVLGYFEQMKKRIEKRSPSRESNNRKQNYRLVAAALAKKSRIYAEMGQKEAVGRVQEALAYVGEQGHENLSAVLGYLKGKGIQGITMDIERAEAQERKNVEMRGDGNAAQAGLIRLLSSGLQGTLNGFSPDSIELKYERLNIPQSSYGSLFFTLVKPDISISTEEARKKISQNPHLSDVVANSRSAIRLVSSLYEGNLMGFGEATCQDRIVEPARSPLIPGYGHVKAAALKEGAYGFNISGSGPTCFAVTDSMEKARHVGRVIIDQFSQVRLASLAYICKVDLQGARKV